MNSAYFIEFAKSVLIGSSNDAQISLLLFYTRYILNNVEERSEVFELVSEFIDLVEHKKYKRAFSRISQLTEMEAAGNLKFDVYPSQKLYVVSGVHCIFVGAKSVDIEQISEYLFLVERALNKIHNSSITHLGRPLRINIPIYITLLKNWPLGENKEEGLLAAYESRAEILLIFPETLTSETDLVASIGHEYGHFLYENKIEEQSIKMWESFYDNSKMVLDLNGVYESRKLFSTDESFDEYMRAFEPTTWFQIHSLFYKEELLRFKIYDVRSLCEVYSSNGEGFELAPVLVEKSPITQYSIVSAQEAFCEGLGLMLAQDFRTIEQIEELKGPRQLSTTQTNMLMRMLRSALHF